MYVLFILRLSASLSVQVETVQYPVGIHSFGGSELTVTNY